MANNSKVAESTKQPKISKDIAIQKALKSVDGLAKIAAAAFFIATSYAYVSGWLKAHQNQHDLSVAGGILVISVALYLYLRKR